MRHETPLEDWLAFSHFRSNAEQRAYNQMIIRDVRQSSALKADAEQTGQRDLGDVAATQDLYRYVLEAGGSGTTYVQEELIRVIATIADPRSISFWLGLLEYNRPRDSFARRRRVFVFAALAYLAIQRDSAEAYDTLAALIDHPVPEMRELAVEYLGKSYRIPDRTLPREILTRLTKIATQDRAFGPRYWARFWLRDVEAPVPLDNPGGVYVLKVKFMWAKRIYRSIAIRSEQGFGDLQMAIQHAIGWDDDHLSAFYMNGKLHDQRYLIAHPYLDDATLYFDEVAIGEIGLVRKHKFIYFFDFGDSHQFEIEVIDILPHAEPGDYPRVVDSHGIAPHQYDWGGDEDEEEV